MTSPWLPVLRWSIVVVTVGGVGLAALTSWGVVQNQALLLAVLAYTVVGMLLTGRRPENSLGWLFLMTGLTMGIAGLIVPLHELARTAPLPLPWYAVAGAWANDVIWPFTLCLLTVWPLMLFPSGHVSRRMRPVLWTSIIGVGLATLTAALQPGITWDSDPRVLRNPVSPQFIADNAALMHVALSLAGFLLLVCGLCAVVSLVVRFRRAEGLERLQLRWFVFAAFVLAVVALVGLALGSLVPEGVSNLMMAVAVAFIPTSCGIAILRYRLYDIDRVVSRSASYAIVTGLLIATYAVVVTSASRLLGETSTLAVAAATLTAAALFRPLLARVQRAVDRRFDREKVDGQRAVQAFGARLTDEVDVDLARENLLEVTRRTLAPASVSLWTVER